MVRIRLPSTLVRLARRSAGRGHFPLPRIGFPENVSYDFGPDSSRPGPGGSDGSSNNTSNNPQGSLPSALSSPPSPSSPSSDLPDPPSFATGGPGSNIPAATAAAAVTRTAKLAPAAVAGIAVGSSLLLFILVVLLVWLAMRRRQQQRDHHVGLHDNHDDVAGNASHVAFAKTVSPSPSSLSLSVSACGSSSASSSAAPSPLPDDDAPPAYEDLVAQGRTHIAGLQAAADMGSVSDGFRQYQQAFAGDAKDPGKTGPAPPAGKAGI